MNSASSAITAERSLIPGENNVATFEELFHLDNNMLLSSLQEENNARLDGIVDIILSSQCREKESEKEVDEGDPENCELYKVGMCKFLQQGFLEPAVTHWIGCELPGCRKCWHELCMGIKLKNDKDRNRYSCICPTHDKFVQFCSI